MPPATRNPIAALMLAAVAGGDWCSRKRILVVGGQRRSTERKQEWNRAEEGALVAMIMLKRRAINPLTTYEVMKRQRRPDRGGIDDSTSRLTGPS